MDVAVIEPPRPLVTAADIPGFHEADDAFVTSMIAAAQAAIDGPTGPWGIAIGIQTLHWTADGFGCSSREELRLPYGPVLEPLAVSYRDPSGGWVPIDVDWLEPTSSGLRPPPGGWPTTACEGGAISIRYRAGYARRRGDGTFEPTPPPNAVAAVILAAQHLKSLAGQNLFLRSDRADGLGERTWTVSDAAGKAIEAATTNLMRPLRVFS